MMKFDKEIDIWTDPMNPPIHPDADAVCNIIRYKGLRIPIIILHNSAADTFENLVYILNHEYFHLILAKLISYKASDHFDKIDNLQYHPLLIGGLED